ncbi:tyrosine-protein kinase RYK-like [Sycon ciliatum]|uniref:tyrosine-protein kinase RYK-like n=1 Tax=Sycon ciliatum TaxID=27933 RepID=UPI0020A94E54|eukprot:scpid34208/ scgid12437/ Hepatocyte growth factor receptor; HGF/SF receptor; Proto-oncogene c-Met; Scatter factor receptor; Tyrosine-protein kinase Met
MDRGRCCVSVLFPLLLVLLCCAGCVKSLDFFIKKDVLEAVLDDGSPFPVTGSRIHFIQNNVINDQVTLTVNSFFSINTRGNELDAADRLFFNYVIGSTEHVQYNITVSSEVPSVADVHLVNTTNIGRLNASKEGEFEIDFRCLQQHFLDVDSSAQFEFVVSDDTGQQIARLSIALDFKVDCNVTVPTTLPPTTIPPTTLAQTTVPVPDTTLPVAGTLPVVMTSGSVGSTSALPAEKKSSAPVLSPLAIILICVGGAAFVLAGAIICAVAAYHRRKTTRSHDVSAGSTPVEDPGSQRIQNDTQYRGMNNSAAAAASNAGAEGQFVDLPPAKSIDDNEDLFTRYLGSEFVINREEVKFGRELGKGAFGVVYEGMWKKHHVAIKTMKGNEGQAEIEKFLEEAQRMKDFHHVNVLGLIGVCSNANGSPQIVVPYMAGGDLMTYLRAHDSVLTPGSIELTEQQRINFAVQSACGMEYLASLNFVHRDLAARNCMLSEDLIVKIADFGLARDIDDSSYYVISSEWKLPVRWMAPESLTVHKFSVLSDVWSYGILLWEIFSSGQVPYPGLDNSQLTAYLLTGQRLIKPNMCPDKLFTIMEDCWKQVPQDRPSFTQILRRIEDFDTNLYQNVLKLACYNNIDPNSLDASHSAIDLATATAGTVNARGNARPPKPRRSDSNTSRPNGVPVSTATPQFEPLNSPVVAASNGSSAAPGYQDRNAKTATMLTTMSFHSDMDDYEGMDWRKAKDIRLRPELTARVYENFTESEL